MKKALILLVLILCQNCNQNPSNTSSFCTYDNVKLDTLNLALSEEELLTTWGLKAFVDLTDYSITNQPEGINVFIVRLQFVDSDSIHGNTSNEFYGHYSIQNNKINMYIHGTTEINEPEWAVNFLNAVPNTDYICIQQSKLFIYFDHSTKVMVFTKITGE